MAYIRIAKTHPGAQIPKRATPGSAGLDLVAAVDAVVPPNGAWLAVETGIAIQFPAIMYARVAPRSGLAFKHGIQVGAGVIDSDYTGSIKVILFNHGTTPFVIQVGDRIAQLIFEKIEIPHLTECAYEELAPTERGAGGFGSTGV
jgi:dUTP pyrophosphatase